MNEDMRGHMIALDGGDHAAVPPASEAQVIGILTTNMALTDMLLTGGISSLLFLRVIRQYGNRSLDVNLRRASASWQHSGHKHPTSRTYSLQQG